MAKRQKEWARRKRDELRDVLGNKCVDCGTTEDLEFDCVIPQGPDHHRRMDWSTRMSFYFRQFEQDNLALRCAKCNGRKGDRTIMAPTVKPCLALNPF